MTVKDIENFAEEVKDVIRQWFKNDGFKDRKLTDTPTDDLQVVNKKYVDDTGGGSGSWSLVSYTTGAAGTTKTVSGLDLATDKGYMIVINARNTVAAAAYSAQINADSTANVHHWASQYYKLTNGAGNAASDTDTSWQLNTGFGDMSITCTMYLNYNSNLPQANWTTGATGFGGDTTVRASTTTGGGYYNSSTNITSIVFSRNDANNADWAIWVFKSSQT